jgi:hypothetical protein
LLISLDAPCGGASGRFLSKVPSFRRQVVLLFARIGRSLAPVRFHQRAMSSNGKRGVYKERPSSSKAASPVERDGDQPWSHERLLRMDAKFRERMQRAIERGLERVPADPALARL